MSWFTALLGGGDLVKSVGKVLDDVTTTDEERLDAQLELTKASRKFDLEESRLIAQQNIAQTEVNKEEARSGHLFQSGWRPAIGWIGAFALLYQFVLRPFLVWGAGLAEAEAPPALDADVLWTMVTGMLGIAGMRSYDKLKRTDTTTVRLR